MVLDSVRCFLAGDDVIRMTHGKTFDLDAAGPCALESFDAVGSEHQIEVKRTVLELHEILSALNLRGMLRGQIESEVTQRLNDRSTVLRRFLNEKVGILSGIGKA